MLTLSENLLIKLIWYKIVKAQEMMPLKKRLREYVDLKFEVLDTKFTTKLGVLDTKVTTLFGGSGQAFDLYSDTGDKSHCLNRVSNWYSTDHHRTKAKRPRHFGSRNQNPPRKRLNFLSKHGW